MKICKTILIWIWLVAGLLVLSGLADKISAQEVDSAQPTRDRAALRALTTRLQAKLLAGRGEVYQQLRSNDRLPNRILNTHPGVGLISVDERGHPRYYSVTNADAAATISTDDVWPGGGGGFALSGAATSAGALGLWDGGEVLATHQELAGRITNRDASSFPSYHATRVAGTLIAAGTYEPDARGMSYNAPLLVHDWFDDTPEMSLALADDGLLISNHSYGVITGWFYGYWSEETGGNDAWGHFWAGDSTVSYSEDYRFGYYDQTCADWDQITYTVADYLIVKAAGNDRNNTRPADTDVCWVWRLRHLAAHQHGEEHPDRWRGGRHRRRLRPAERCGSNRLYLLGAD